MAQSTKPISRNLLEIGIRKISRPGKCEQRKHGYGLYICRFSINFIVRTFPTTGISPEHVARKALLPWCGRKTKEISGVFPAYSFLA
jgi:hypothetical protein